MTNAAEPERTSAPERTALVLGTASELTSVADRLEAFQRGMEHVFAQAAATPVITATVAERFEDSAIDVSFERGQIQLPPAQELRRRLTEAFPKLRVAEREATSLGRMRVHGDNLTVNGVDADVDVDIQAMPLDFLITTDGKLAIDVAPRSERAERDAAGFPTPQGTLDASADQDALVALVLEYADAVIREETGYSVELRSYDLHSLSPRELSGRADALVKRGILRAGAEAAASLMVSPEGVVTVEGLELRSKNPIVAAVLIPLRKQVSEHLSFDLAKELAQDGLVLSNLEVHAGMRLKVTARLTAAPAAS